MISTAGEGHPIAGESLPQVSDGLLDSVTSEQHGCEGITIASLEAGEEGCEFMILIL
jgi:hypothetical protein